jgi:hypothetical protein
LWVELPTAGAQEILIRQFPQLDTIPSEKGPNRKHYYATFFGFGSLFGSSDSSGSDINPAKSYWVSLGFRYKRKYSSFFNTGWDLSIEARNFNIKQSDEKVFGGKFTHQRERLFQYTANVSFFTRFNLSKRGDHLGKYIDLFATAIYAPIERHYTYDKIDAIYGETRGKHVFTHLQYIERFFGQVGIRYGLSFLQFQVFYRPLDMFKNSSRFPYPELPRFGAGIVIDIENVNNPNID